MSGDLSDLGFAEEATRGAAVVFDCSNPAYDQWDRLLLPLGRGAMHGAANAGARLVALDNLYMYGRAAGPMTEDTPVRPVSKKGELRARLAEERLSAHRRGELRLVIGRAADFFGPRTTLSAMFGERFFQRLQSNKSAECVGDPDQLHAYSYTPDVAAGLITLSEHDDALGRVWHLPTAAAETTRQMVERFEAAFGRRIGITRIPGWMLRGMGLFSPLVREVAEMTYQWELPFVLDDSRFRARFGVGPTELGAAVRATAAWAQSSAAKAA
jgi:nucleoside-diphosphate-sugar epimerase